MPPRISRLSVDPRAEILKYLSRPDVEPAGGAGAVVVRELMAVLESESARRGGKVCAAPACQRRGVRSRMSHYAGPVSPTRRPILRNADVEPHDLDGVRSVLV